MVIRDEVHEAGFDEYARASQHYPVDYQPD
jgi:hypothetical protein